MVIAAVSTSRSENTAKRQAHMRGFAAASTNDSTRISPMKNIILLVSDTYRYDNLFDRADMPVHTPSLDAFAECAVSVEQFYAASFPTIPQRTDLITGRCGWPWYDWQPLSQSGRNRMPALLRQNGYVSQLLCDCPHLFKAGFDREFDAAHALRGQEGDVHFLRMNHPIVSAMPPEKTRTPRSHFDDRNLVDLHRWTNACWAHEEDRFAPRTATLAMQWLEENWQYNPFLLWVDFFDPHEPWDPPEYMVNRYDPGYSGAPMLHPNYGRADVYSDAELRNLRAHYCAEAELVDRWVGRVLQKIDDLELWDNSIVVFTTDHGISLGEHNRTGKSNANEGDDRYWPLYPEIARIPFIIAAPGLQGGRSLNIMAQPQDILPTLLELAGANADPPDPFHGISLAPQLTGADDESPRDIIVAGRFCAPETADGAMPPESVTPVLYTPEWAYAPVGAQGTPELYDLRSDAEAQHNIAPDNPARVAEMRDLFGTWLEQMDAPAPLHDVFA